jgi:histidinol-phosphate aminotransferase
LDSIGLKPVSTKKVYIGWVEARNPTLSSGLNPTKNCMDMQKWRMHMSRYWSKLAATIKPYVPGEQPKDRKYIKLNTNENPYPPSPKVIEAIRAATDDTLRLYPDPMCGNLRQTIAKYFGLSDNRVFVGNGSDELLAFCFPAFFNPGGRPILFADITYSFYPVYCRLFGIPCETLPLDEEFRMPVEQFYKPNGGILIANPNAPTGRFLELSAIESILQSNRGSVVIVDEAYVDFGGESAVGLIKKYENLLVVQTLSKSRSLAGLRVGFAMGHEDLIEGLRRVKDSINSYTLDRLALAGAQAAIEDDAYFRETTAKIIKTREETTKRLEALGFKVIPSTANFIFISHPDIAAEKLFGKLRERGVLVRYFKLPRIDNWLRVSVGTDAEMAACVQAFDSIVRG